MSEEAYRIVDDGTHSGVHIFDPTGAEITNDARKYTITRDLHTSASVRIEILSSPREVVDGEVRFYILEGPVVCEIVQGEKVNA